MNSDQSNAWGNPLYPMYSHSEQNTAWDSTSVITYYHQAPASSASFHSINPECSTPSTSASESPCTPWVSASQGPMQHSYTGSSSPDNTCTGKFDTPVNYPANDGASNDQTHANVAKMECTDDVYAQGNHPADDSEGDDGPNTDNNSENNTETDANNDGAGDAGGEEEDDDWARALQGPLPEFPLLLHSGCLPKLRRLASNAHEAAPTTAMQAHSPGLPDRPQSLDPAEPFTGRMDYWLPESQLGPPVGYTAMHDRQAFLSPSNPPGGSQYHHDAQDHPRGSDQACSMEWSPLETPDAGFVSGSSLIPAAVGTNPFNAYNLYAVGNGTFPVGGFHHSGQIGMDVSSLGHVSGDSMGGYCQSDTARDSATGYPPGYQPDLEVRDRGREASEDTRVTGHLHTNPRSTSTYQVSPVADKWESLQVSSILLVDTPAAVPVRESTPAAVMLDSEAYRGNVVEYDTDEPLANPVGWTPSDQPAEGTLELPFEYIRPHEAPTASEVVGKPPSPPTVSDWPSTSRVSKRSTVRKLAPKPLNPSSPSSSIPYFPQYFEMVVEYLSGPLGGPGKGRMYSSPYATRLWTNLRPNARCAQCTSTNTVCTVPLDVVEASTGMVMSKFVSSFVDLEGRAVPVGKARVVCQSCRKSKTRCCLPAGNDPQEQSSTAAHSVASAQTPIGGSGVCKEDAMAPATS